MAWSFLTQLLWGWSCSYINADILFHKLLVFTSADLPRLCKSCAIHVSVFFSPPHTVLIPWKPVTWEASVFPSLWEALVILPFSLPSFGGSALLFFYGNSPSPLRCVWLTYWSKYSLALNSLTQGVASAWPGLGPSDSLLGVQSAVERLREAPELSHSSFICEILTEILGTALFLSFLRTACSDLPSVLIH